MKKNKFRMIIGMILFTFALITIIINYFFGSPIKELWLNLFSETIGIIITVFIVEKLIDRQWINSDIKIAYEIEFIIQKMADDYVSFFKIDSNNLQFDIKKNNVNNSFSSIYDAYVSTYLLTLIRDTTIEFNENLLIILTQKHYDTLEKSLLVLSTGSSGYVLDALLDLRMRLQRVLNYQTRNDIDKLINREKLEELQSKIRLLTRLHEVYVSMINLDKVISSNVCNANKEFGKILSI